MEQEKRKKIIVVLAIILIAILTLAVVGRLIAQPFSSSPKSFKTPTYQQPRQQSPNPAQRAIHLQHAIRKAEKQREQAIGYLKSRWRIEADALEQSGLSAEQFKKADAQLVAKYRIKTLDIDMAFRQQINRLRREYQ